RVKRVGVVAKAGAAEARAPIQELLEWLRARGLSAVLEKETAGMVPAASVPCVTKAELPAHADLLVVLGGDGTLLSMARAVGDLGVPLLGVNLGGLGFLTATTLDEMFPALEALLAGRMEVDERMMLTVPIVLPGMHRIEVTLMADQDVMVTVDGQIGVGLREHDTVEVVKAAARVRLVRFPQKEFFSVLRTKLKWGER